MFPEEERCLVSTYLLRQSLLWAFDHCRRGRLFTFCGQDSLLCFLMWVCGSDTVVLACFGLHHQPLSRVLKCRRRLRAQLCPTLAKTRQANRIMGYFLRTTYVNMVLFSDLSLDRCQVWPFGGARGVDHGVRAAPGVVGVQPRPGGRLRGGPAAPDPQKTSRMGFLRCLLLDCSAAV